MPGGTADSRRLCYWRTEADGEACHGEQPESSHTRAKSRRSERLPGVCFHPVRPSITIFLPPAGGGEGTTGGGAVDDVAGSGSNVSRPPGPRACRRGSGGQAHWVSRRSRPGASLVKYRAPFWALREVWDQEA